RRRRRGGGGWLSPSPPSPSPGGGRRPPLLGRLAGRQPVERAVVLDRAELPGVVLKPPALGDVLGVKGAAPVPVLPARGTDENRHHRHATPAAARSPDSRTRGVTRAATRRRRPRLAAVIARPGAAAGTPSTPCRGGNRRSCRRRRAGPGHPTAACRRPRRRRGRAAAAPGW